jgi:hypothetical protein
LHSTFRAHPPFGSYVSVAVRTQLAATGSAKVKLKVNSAKGLTAWLNGEPVSLDGKTLFLAAGTHVLTIAVRLDERTEGVRIEIEYVPAAAGKASGEWGRHDKAVGKSGQPAGGALWARVRGDG